MLEVMRLVDADTEAFNDYMVTTDWYLDEDSIELIIGCIETTEAE